MKLNLAKTLIIASFTSCTAINQKDAFLDSLPIPSNVVFSDDFESGLGKWTQSGNGTWTTVTPGANGAALKSPSSAGSNTFNITTNAYINLLGKTGCLLEYDANFNIGAVASSATPVSAKILFGATTIASFKEATGYSSVTSSGQYLSRRFQLPDNSYEKLTIQTAVVNNTTAAADLYVDNIKITCGKSFGAALTLVSEDFESGTANWLLASPWTLTAGIGANSSKAPYTGVTAISDNTDHIASYTPNINLQGRSGCKLNYFYAYTISGGGGVTCYGLEWNAARIDTRCNNGPTTGSGELLLTAYEGLTANSLTFRCRDSTDGLTSIICAMDNVVVSCQQ